MAESDRLREIIQYGPALQDRNHDFYPDKLAVKMIVPEKCSASMMAAASNMAFVLAWRPQQ